MKTTSNVRLLIMSSLFATNVVCASVPTVLVQESGGESTLDRAVGGSNSAIEIRANKDNSEASIRFAGTVSESAPSMNKGVFSTFALTATAPVDKNNDSTTLANLDGFTNAVTLEFKFTKFYVSKRSYVPTKEEDAVYMKAIAEGAAKNGGKPSGAVSADQLSQFAPELEPGFLRKLWDLDASQWIVGGSATVGHQEFKFLDSITLGDGKTTKIPYGAKGFLALSPASSHSLWTLGFEYQSAFKDAKSKAILAPPDASGIQEVRTGPIGQPTSDDKHLFSLEMRRLISFPGIDNPLGVSVKGTYDAKSKNWGVNIPIMVVRDDKGNLTGGFELGWEDKDNKFTLGVIVGGAFNLFH